MRLVQMFKHILIGLIAFSFSPTIDAAVTVTVNGSSYSIPQTNEKGWGNNVTTWIQAISANTIQATGGTFSLTSDLNFGSSFGLISPYFTSSSSNPATAGVLRLANGDAIEWRNNANGANILLAKNTSDQLTYAGNGILSNLGVLLSSAFPALTGDVTTSAGSLSTTIAKIQGTSVGGVTGTGNVVFSASPQFSGNVGVGAAGLSGVPLYVSGGNIALSGNNAFINYGLGKPGDTDTEAVFLEHDGASGVTFKVFNSGSGSLRNLKFYMGGSNVATLDTSGNFTANNISGSTSGTNTGDVTIGTANGLTRSGQQLSLGLSSSSTNGALSSTDWTTFNNKQNALSGFSTNGAVYATSSSAITSTAAGTQYQSLQAGASSVPTFDAIHLDQSAAVTGILPNTNTTAASANTASAIVARNASGNFTAGTITAALTGTASGNTTYTANNHGVVVSGSGNAMTVIAPDASASKVLKSGGSSADPSWLAYDNANTPSTIVARDFAGNFSAGTITASTLIANTALAGALNGNTSGSNYGAGFVGQVISSNSSANPTNLTSYSATQVGSISLSLTAGIWDITASINYLIGGVTTGSGASPYLAQAQYQIYNSTDSTVLAQHSGSIVTSDGVLYPKQSNSTMAIKATLNNTSTKTIQLRGNLFGFSGGGYTAGNNGFISTNNAADTNGITFYAVRIQ